MKNPSLDQSTPFLAFYDLLRIRGIYSEPERRERLVRGFRRAMALAATFVALALPRGAEASVLGDLAGANGVIAAGNHTGLDAGVLMDSADDLRIGADGTGSALFQTGGHWDVTGGALRGRNVYLLAGGGLSFSGGTFNVESLVAAAINKETYSLGERLEKGDVTGSISGSAAGSGSRVYIGTTVGAADGTIVQTDGMSDDAWFTVASTGGTITFGGTMGDASKLKASTIEFADNAETSGTVDATDGTVSGSFTQSGGTVTAATVGADGQTVTQTGGSLSATTVAAALSQSGNAVVDAGSISGALSQSGNAVANVSGSIASLAQAGGTATAGSITGDATVAGTLNTATVGGAATVSGTLNGVDGLTLDSLEQTGGAITGNGAITVAGTARQTGGTLDAGSSTLRLSSGGELAGYVSAGSISATGQAVSQTGGEISLGSGALTAASFEQTGGTATFGSTGAAVTQSGAGTINATTLSGAVAQDGGTINATTMAAVTQSGSGTINATTISGSVGQDGGTINATTLRGTVTQNGGTIAARDGNLTLSQAITTQGGTLDASSGTLTLAGGSELSGTVNAQSVALTGSGTRTLTQKSGTTTVSGGSFLASGNAFVQQGGTLALSNSGENTVNATVTQDAGTIRSQNGSLTLAGTVEKNAGTIGSSGRDLNVNANVTQEESGRLVGSTVTLASGADVTQASGTGIAASTLALEDSSKAYALNGGANNVQVLSGTAQSVTLDNGANAVRLTGLEVSGDATVAKAGAVTLDGVSAANVVVQSSTGAVSDTADQTVATTVSLGTAGGKVASVSLANGTGALTVSGIDAAGAVLLRRDGGVAITQAGDIQAVGNVGVASQAIAQGGNKISGANVTLDAQGADFALGGDVEATGDILVKSDDATVTAGSDGSLSTTGGNVVLSGGSVAVDGATLSATGSGKGVGLVATAGNLSVANATITAPTVILETQGDSSTLDVGAGVSMNAAEGSSKDASLIVNASGTIDGEKLLGDDRPSDKLTVAKGTIDLSGNPEIKLTQFAYKTTGDVDVTFTGKTLALESDGAVKVTATGDALTVAGFNAMTTEGGASAAITAANAAGGSAVTVNGEGDGSATPTDGLVGSSVTLDASGDVTVASGAKISATGDGQDLDLATATGKSFTVNGTVESQKGNVSITSGGALAVNGTVQAMADGKSVALSSGNGENLTLAGTVAAGSEASRGALSLDAGTGKIVQSAGSVAAAAATLKADADLAGDVTATKIDATGKTVTQNGTGTVAADEIVATKVVQSAAGKIQTDKITGAFEQTDAAAAASLAARTAENGLTVTGLVEQKGKDAKIGTDGEAVTLGSLDQDAGTVNATTLTLLDDSTSGGDINAEAIAADGKNLKQDGDGTIKVSGTITAAKVEQAANGKIYAQKIDAEFVQSGAATADAYAEEGADKKLEITGKVTQEAVAATLGSADTALTLKGGAEQKVATAAAKVLANTLVVNGAANAYDLKSTGGNNVADLSGTAKSVTLHNGESALVLHGIETTDGVTVQKAGAVSDEETADGAKDSVSGAVAVQDAASVLIDDAAKVEVGEAGIAATGNVGLKAAEIVQGGAVSGGNVTLDQTEGTLAVAKNVTATSGDILLRAAEGTVKVGDATVAPNVNAANNVVVKGKSVEISGAKFKANELGVEATDATGKSSLANAEIVAANGVALKSAGDIDIDSGVVAGKTSATDKDADMVVNAEGTLKLVHGDADRPVAGDKLDVTVGHVDLTGYDLTDGSAVVDFNSLAYTEVKEGTNLKFTFAGKKLSVRNDYGSVDIKTTGDVQIVDSSSSGVAKKVEALDAVAALQDPDADAVKESVDIDGNGGSDATGVTAKGDVVVAGEKDVEVASGATVASTDKTVKVSTSGGELKVNGAVRTEADGQSVTLETTGTGDAAKDVTLAGTVTSKGYLSIASAKNVKQTAGSVKADGTLKLTAGAGDVSQTGGSITATGETVATAENGSVSLAATADGAAANDFGTLTAVAKDKIEVSDKNDLTVVSATGKDGAATTGDISLAAATALSTTGAVNAGGDATLTAATIDADGAITVAGAATATATGADGDAVAADFADAVQGATVSLSAANGTLHTASSVTATAGDATLTAATIDADGAITAGGAATATATGADGDAVAADFADAVQGATVSLSAANGTLHTASSVTATAGNATLTARSVDAAGAVSATGVAALNATAGNVNAGGTIDAANIDVDATTGVTLGGATTATQSTAVRTTGGDIAVNANATAPTAVYRAENGNVVIAGGSTVSGNALGIRGNAIQNDGTVAGVDTLALVTAGAATYDDSSIPAGVANVGLQSGGNLTVNVTGGIAANGANVTAQGVNVTANGIVSTGGTVDVSAGGNIAAAAVAGAGGTTVTARNGGNIAVTGNIGQGGATTIEANGAAVNAATLASGGALDVNNAGAVTANVAAGGAATIQAASLTSGNTTTGGNLTFDNVTGAANLGNVNVNGDMNGTVNGNVTVAGGEIDSVGQAGGFNSGDFNVNGLLTTGAFTADTGELNLNAGLTTGAMVLNATSVNGAGQTLTVNGAADINATGDVTLGQVAITGDLSGTTGTMTIAGGTTGSIGQNGVDGLNAGTFTLNGALNGGNNVNITANGGFNGGGVLTAGTLTLQGGDIGTADQPFQVSAGTLQNITGANVYLTSQAGGTVYIGTIQAQTAGGQLTLRFDNANQIFPVAGGQGLDSAGNINLTVSNPNARFGSPDGKPNNMIRVNFVGNLVLNGDGFFFIQVDEEDYGDLGDDSIGGNGFVIAMLRDRDGSDIGYGVITTKANMAKINRALAFTADNPELKSKQGVFGDPAFLHTKMNASEARSIGNMDVFALNDVDFKSTWRDILENADKLELDWKPSVSVLDNPVNAKLKADKSEAEMQPEVHVFGMGGI